MSWLGKKKARKPKSSKFYEESMRKAKRPDPDVPSLTPLASLVGFLAAMVALGVGCCMLGHPLVGAVFVVLGVGLPTGVVVMAAKLLPLALGRRATADSGDVLGDFLGAGGYELSRSLMTRLSEPERAQVEANRVAEADATRAWVASLAGGASFETVETVSDDGCRLVGHVLACNPGSPRWLVFVHGFEGTWRAGMTHARRAAEQGFNLLFVELRAHGASGGDWVGAGWLDRRDVVAWCSWLATRAGDGARVVVAGQSMGAASVLMAAAEEDLAPQVVACVADCAYTDFWNVAVRAIARGGGQKRANPVHPLIDVQRLMLRLRRGGYDVARARPVDAISRSRVPVVLVHGEDDALVPSYMAEMLSEAAGGAAAGEGHELVLVPSAGHCLSALADPERYYGAVFSFVARYL